MSIQVLSAAVLFTNLCLHIQHDFLTIHMLCRLRDNQRKLYSIISMQLPSSILLLADQSWVLLMMSSLSPKRISKRTLKTITQLLEWYWTLQICDCHGTWISIVLSYSYYRSMMGYLLVENNTYSCVFRLLLLLVMLSMRILYNRQESCSRHCQLTLQQLACWLLRSQPFLLVLRYVIHSRFTCDAQILIILCYSIGSNH